MTFSETPNYERTSHSHQKRSQTRKLTIFGNTKQVIQDYDTVFDNSIPFRKNDPLRILECSVPGLPGLPTLEVEWKSGTKAVPWHDADVFYLFLQKQKIGAQGRPSITVIRPQKALQLETLLGGLGGTPSRRRQTLTSDFKFVR